MSEEGGNVLIGTNIVKIMMEQMKTEIFTKIDDTAKKQDDNFKELKKKNQEQDNKLKNIETNNEDMNKRIKALEDDKTKTYAEIAAIAAKIPLINQNSKNKSPRSGENHSDSTTEQKKTIQEPQDDPPHARILYNGK